MSFCLKKIGRRAAIIRMAALPASLAGLILCSASGPALASRPITDKDGLACLSGADLPPLGKEEQADVQVDGQDSLVLDPVSLGYMITVERAGPHRAVFGLGGKTIQAIDFNFDNIASNSVCFRYDKSRRNWSISPSSLRGGICGDCMSDSVITGDSEDLRDTR